MGREELIDALRREGDEKAGAIRREAEAEAERIRSEGSASLARLREEQAMREVALCEAAKRNILAETSMRVRMLRLASDNGLAQRLYGLAQRALPRLRDEGYAELFASLAAELPAIGWDRVKVNPADRELAEKQFPCAEVLLDEAVIGGFEAEGKGGRLRIVNTLEKRLERSWPEMPPELIRDICREI